ncbi:hypothetical protein, partial [Mesorhizobium sp. M8A.F.Ca.ET.213.01.1.1]|uniref:hypothetical protein n=1 Tax=Mesorhizobium sp. M8A.F.Ca.ET.213.01.1.1 TaxID=2563970 RepID=UPI001AEDAF2D
ALVVPPVMALSGLGLLARPKMDRHLHFRSASTILIWYYQFRTDVKPFLERSRIAGQAICSGICLFSLNFPTP